MKRLLAQKISCTKYGEIPANGLVADSRCWTEWTDEWKWFPNKASFFYFIKIPTGGLHTGMKITACLLF